MLSAKYTYNYAPRYIYMAPDAHQQQRNTVHEHQCTIHAHQQQHKQRGTCLSTWLLLSSSLSRFATSGAATSLTQFSMDVSSSFTW